jgi:hypothetical protein
MSFSVGEAVPWFYGPTEVNPRFRFDSIAGRYVVLSLFGSAGREDSAEMLDGLWQNRSGFDDVRAMFFGVTIDPADHVLGRIRDQVPGIRFFRDFDQTISRLYGAVPRQPGDPGRGDTYGCGAPAAVTAPPEPSVVAATLLEYQPFSLILDERLRVLAVCDFDEPAWHIERILQFLDRQPLIPGSVAAQIQAPVLIVPRVFEPELCRRLVDLYEQHGGEDSGFMRDIGGRTVGVLDYNHKRRSDYTIDDESVRTQCMHRIHDRLAPEIFKAFQFRATRMERYIVACYESATAGHFRPHRDNTTKGTAHRRFAVSLHLNSDEYTGGEVRFPEFGQQLYKAPTGGAVVFSCSLLHEATPVLTGKRFVFLPFLYDDAAAQVRAQNEQFLAGNLDKSRSIPFPIP